MNDLEKAIKGTEICLSGGKPDRCRSCPYHLDGCDRQRMQDTLALLKEQEAVEPYSMNAERTYGICPQCGKIIFRYGNVEENHYCGVCGKAVKWN